MSKNWAICIGINEYSRLKHLRYAVSDAAAMRDFFLQEGCFERVYYFADDAPPIETPQGPMEAKPTFSNLLDFFEKRFQTPFLDVGDNLWLFFAGHGVLHEGHDYLMPIDVSLGNLERTALRLSDLTAWLRNSGADNTVLLLDACRSQDSRRGLGLGSEEQQGMVTVYACSPREESYEIEKLGHGAFTYALLEGFRLQGGENCATVERLDHHLRYQVPMLNQQYGKPLQTPYTIAEPVSKNHLILLPQKATLQDVLTLKNDAQEAELANDLYLAERLWIRVLAASPADRQAVLALQRIAVKRSGQTASAGHGTTSNTDNRSAAERTLKPRPAAPTYEFEVVTVNAKGQIAQRERKSAEYRREDLGQGISLDLVLIPGGTFRMGSLDGEGDDDEKPQHQVTVPSFLMGKYAVTQAQWKAVAALPKVERDLAPSPARFKGKNRPVEQVSWDDAVEFCQRLSKRTGRSYRLPSEAEWEYACRAGTMSPFHFGETITADLANYDGNSIYGSGPKGQYRERTTEVGSFKVANTFGLYDMHGNVWEWCADHWHDSHKDAPIDGSAWTTDDGSYIVLRGGSWFVLPRSCRSAYRGRGARDDEINSFGFRVVCAS